MRYYDIQIKDPSTGKLIRQYTSYPNGKIDPNSLLVEMDIPVAPFSTPMGNAFVRVWGIGLKEIAQSSDLNGKTIEVYGGMQKGLPLANPAQSGLLMQGEIFQAFGNWQGVDQTLDIIIITGSGAQDSPKNIVIDWKAGTPLSEAIGTLLKTAFPDSFQFISINKNLVLSSDQVGYYESMDQFAAYIKGLSRSIIGGDYAGVEIFQKQGSFFVYDGSTQNNPRQLEFYDLVGQPTWINAGQIQAACVMRADLAVGDYVKLPVTQITTTAQSYSQYRNGSIFQGVYQIAFIRHIGNSRQPDANSWITTINLKITFNGRQ